MAEVRVLTVEQILDEVNYVVADEGYTLEDFIAEAQDDTLTNARLRELWITFQDWLV